MQVAFGRVRRKTAPTREVRKYYYGCGSETAPTREARKYYYGCGSETAPTRKVRKYYGSVRSRYIPIAIFKGGSIASKRIHTKPRVLWLIAVKLDAAPMMPNQFQKKMIAVKMNP